MQYIYVYIRNHKNNALYIYIYIYGHQNSQLFLRLKFETEVYSYEL